MASTVWSELYAGRSDWAIDAYRRFVATMHPSLRDDLARQDHVSMVAYGPTQVGKTTLILTTLGVKKDVFEHVEAVLRGGQQSGKSATVLATRYGKSRDENWWLGEHGPFLADDMRAELGVIRARMERGEELDSDIVDVKIPRGLFAPDVRCLDINIIDLPGAHAANEAEVKHVRRLAERYVPLADVVLLVTRVDHLGSLHPAALALECLRDWAAQPEKFRVILTHTFSAASVRDWFGRQRRASNTDSGFEFSADALREKLYGELSTHLMPLPVAGERCLFPVEFGKSWDDLSTAHREYFSEASAISIQVMTELLEGLVVASNPYRRLAAAFDLNALVRRKQDQLDAEQARTKLEIESQIDEVKLGLEVAEKSLEVAVKNRDRFAAVWQFMQDPACFAALKEQVEEAISARIDEPKMETKRALLRAAQAHEDTLIAQWRVIDFDDPTAASEHADGLHGTAWLKELTGLRPTMAPKVEEAYEEFRQTVEGRFGGDKYLSWMPGSSYADDCKLLRISAQDAIACVVDTTLEWVRSGLKKLGDDAARSIIEWEKAIKASEQKIDEYVRDREVKQRALGHKVKAYADAREAMQESIERSVAFRRYMTDGYICRDEVLTNEIAVERSSARRFFLIALRDMHRKEYPAAIEGRRA